MHFVTAPDGERIKLLRKASQTAGFPVGATASGHLRVIDLPKPSCKGYVYGCACEHCKARANGLTPIAPRQPWTPIRRQAA